MNDVRAAAERLRMHKNGERLEDVYPWKNGRRSHELRDDDYRTLANAYLALSTPADAAGLDLERIALALRTAWFIAGGPDRSIVKPTWLAVAQKAVELLARRSQDAERMLAETGARLMEAGAEVERERDQWRGRAESAEANSLQLSAYADRWELQAKATQRDLESASEEVDQLRERVRRLEGVSKLLDDIDCCPGYSIPDADMPKFWNAQEKARAALVPAPEVTTP